MPYDLIVDVIFTQNDYVGLCTGYIGLDMLMYRDNNTCTCLPLHHYNVNVKHDARPTFVFYLNTIHQGVCIYTPKSAWKKSSTKNRSNIPWQCQCINRMSRRNHLTPVILWHCGMLWTWGYEHITLSPCILMYFLLKHLGCEQMNGTTHTHVLVKHHTSMLSLWVVRM